MRIEHLAIWVNDLEEMKKFYNKYFKMNCSEKYVNKKKMFSSYFLSFATGARIEIMHQPDIATSPDKKEEKNGLTHFAISVENKDKVNQLTEVLEKMDL